MGTQPWRVLLVDDHDVVREGIRGILQEKPYLQVCAEAKSVEAALQAIEKNSPDVVVVDISLQDSNGLELVRHLADQQSCVKTVVFSHRSAWLMSDRAAKAGAHGYVSKQTGLTDLSKTIRAVMTGDAFVCDVKEETTDRAQPLLSGIKQLTESEYQVFERHGEGLEATAISQQLGCSVNTVRTRLERIRDKLGLKNAAEVRHAAISWQIAAM